MHLWFTAVSQARLTHSAADCNTHTHTHTHTLWLRLHIWQGNLFRLSQLTLSGHLESCYHVVKTQMIKFLYNNCQRDSEIINYEQ